MTSNSLPNMSKLEQVNHHDLAAINDFPVDARGRVNELLEQESIPMIRTRGNAKHPRTFSTHSAFRRNGADNSSAFDVGPKR